MESMMPPRKKRAAGKPAKAATPAEAPAVIDVEEAPPVPAHPARGMTTEQIRRVGNRIAEHERDLKNSTSRR
jgi:hypothetical protein